MKLTWLITTGTDAIFVRPPPDLLEAETNVGVRQFVAELRVWKLPPVLVIDIRELRSYDQGSRQAWQSTIRANRKRLKAVIFISDNPIYRMVGAGVGLYCGVTTRFVKDEQRAQSAVAEYYPKRTTAGQERTPRVF